VKKKERHFMILRKTLKNISPYIPGRLKEGAIKLASNENPLGASPKAVERMKSIAEKMSLYPDGSCTGLKLKLAAEFGLNPENFVTGNGSDEVLLLTAGAFIEPGNNSVTSETTFSEYAFATNLFGGTTKTVKMKDGRFQLNEIAAQIDEKTRLIFLCNPNNPTGTYFNQNSLMEFMGKVPENVLVVVDEAYKEYVKAPDFPDTIKMLNKYGNLLILRTFSKIYGLAGLRVGYGIGHKDVIDALNKAREPFNVNAMGQEAAIAALDDAEFVAKSIEVNETGKNYLYREFDRLKLRYYPTEANFIFVTINQDCIKAFEKLMDLGVTIRPMKSFGVNDAIRVTVGIQEQNEFFIRRLEKII
jgi:histidinol-phosphate aminotransferase